MVAKALHFSGSAVRFRLSAGPPPARSDGGDRIVYRRQALEMDTAIAWPASRRVAL